MNQNQVCKHSLLFHKSKYRKKENFNRDSGRVGEKKAISSLIKRNFVAVSNILVKKCGA